MNDKYYVSVKAAIYSTDNSSVLVMQFPTPNGHGDIYGLPGGGVDTGEEPDRALARELTEELAISIDHVKRADFFLHRDGKIVLAYTGEAPRDIPMHPSHPEFEYGVWKTKSEIETIDINPSYRDFILNNWPAQN